MSRAAITTEPLSEPRGAARAVGAVPRRWFLAVAVGAGLATATGCAATRAGKVGLPAKHSLQADQLLVLSDFKLSPEHPLIRDLIVLRRQVAERLDLPLGSKQIIVYLFSDELTYRQFWHAAYPEYPIRRAYFVQSPDRQLAVYTSWSDRIQEDLRHEFTHGLLHAALHSVPLWLDEGLAEYFEVAGDEPGAVNPKYSDWLATAIQNDWRPDLRRLEQLEKVAQMKQPDYRESWAWVHFMLHGSPVTRQILLTHLQELQTTSAPTPLSDKLQKQFPDVETRFLNYVATLNSTGGWIATQPGRAGHDDGHRTQ